MRRLLVPTVAAMIAAVMTAGLATGGRNGNAERLDPPYAIGLWGDLPYSDLQAAYDFLVRVFGLGPGELTRDNQGRIVHGELQAGDGVVWLHPESPKFGLSSPRRNTAAPACSWRWWTSGSASRTPSGPGGSTATSLTSTR